MALSDKHIPEGALPDPTIAEAIRARLDPAGNLSCPDCFAIAEALGVAPGKVGRTTDLMQVHLVRCQLGFYGYPAHEKGWNAEVKAVSVPDGFAEALLAARNSAGVLGCAAIWEVAARFGVARLRAGWEVERLGVRVKGCQLGAY